MTPFNLTEFFAMGGHGFYVWSSFAIVAVVMLLNVVLPLRTARRLREEIRARSEALS